jgi:hypothetical protein
MTTNNKNIIIWQKWVDPFGEDDTNELLDSISYYKEDKDDEYDNFYDDSKEETNINNQENKQHKFIRSKNNIRVMATPMGIIPMTENTASGKIFNFWTGHTNFDITLKVAALIEQVSGVETLDIFTRYRFRIAIGKAFKDATVMQEINEKVYEYLE